MLNRRANSPRPEWSGRSPVSHACVLGSGMVPSLHWQAHNHLSTTIRHIPKVNGVYFNRIHNTPIKYKTRVEFFPTEPSEQCPQCKVNDPILWVLSACTCWRRWNGLALSAYIQCWDGAFNSHSPIKFNIISPCHFSFLKNSDKIKLLVKLLSSLRCRCILFSYFAKNPANTTDQTKWSVSLYDQHHHP